jgi:hypothetical protein
MLYQQQIDLLNKILHLLVVRGSVFSGISPFSMAEWMRENDESLSKRGHSFIQAAISKGWLKMQAGAVRPSGQLMMFARAHWSDLFPGFRDQVLAIARNIERLPAMDDMVATDLLTAGVDDDWKDLALETLLSAVPGVALQTSSGGSLIRLSLAMADSALLMHLVDIERPPPHALALPLIETHP